MQQRKVLALVSGGLDSMLAAKLMVDQGLHVEAINFYIGFCGVGSTLELRKRNREKVRADLAQEVSKKLGIKLHVLDVVDEFKQVLIKPRHGYGAHLNPCVDCKIFMLFKARQWLEQHGFDFIVTGEVLGQRPKSQRKDTLPVIAKESGLQDILLRPLSAKNLKPTLPEREGWVDRDKLCAFNGRSRKPQIALAEQFGWQDYQQPAGGCLLTEASFTARMRDLWQHRGKQDYSADDINLLRVGRHLRPNERFKLIIGREEAENDYLEKFSKHFISLRPASHVGAMALLEGQPTTDDLQLAAQLLARFGKAVNAEQVTIEVTDLTGKVQARVVKPLPAAAVVSDWYIDG